ncbi:MAG: hypothetical protein M3N93_11650 [Acidobacteriota bacterium]|nr:hypothetical protein [Acidobacteriota bacterium]
MATAFAGVSFGQALTCLSGSSNGVSANAPQINAALRVESQTEQLSLLQFACTGTSAAAGTTSATFTFTTNLPITSKAVSTGSSNSEATLIVGGTVGAGGVVTGGTAVQGTVSGNTVTFPNVTLTTGPGGVVNALQLANVRVNASTATTTNFQTTESGLVAYTTSTSSGVTTAYATVPSTNSSGLVVPSLGAPKITAIVAPYTVCTGNAATTPVSFTLNINQLISGAFLGLGQPPVGEAGQYAPGGGSPVGTANADIINVTLAGLPAGGTAYVSQSVTVASGTNSTTLSIVGSTAATTPAGTVAYAVPASGTVTIPYTVTAVAGLGAPANSNYPVSVYVTFAANSTTTATTVTGTYAYAPAAATLAGLATTVPTFVTSNFTPANGVLINLCQTTLLFPYVTSQFGFSTGIAIANTSVDNLGAAGASFATAQTGTCKLSFYGNSKPTPSTVNDPNGPLAGGSVSTFLVDGLAPGYSGYMIAVCPFNYAHGFAFITYGLPNNNGVAEGYLAEVLGTGDRNQSLTSGDGAITF